MTEQATTSEKEGLSFEDAIMAFGPPDIVKNIGTKKEVEDFDAIFGHVPGHDSLRKILEWVVEALLAAIKARAAEITSKHAAKIAWKRMLDDLRAGRLVASGLNPKREPMVREIVPQTLWSSRIRFSNRGKPLGNSRYQSLLFAKTEDIPESWEKPKEEQTEHGPVAGRKSGRPSKAETIHAAYEQITKDYTLNFTDHVAAIRAAAKEILGDDSDKGLSEDAIYKAVGRLFADEKASAKPSEKR